MVNIFGDNNRFKIYKTTTKTYIFNKIYSIIRKLARYMLETQDIWDNHKTFFFELNKLIFDFTLVQKDK